MEIRVGIRELKNKLSRYIGEVKRGYTVIITERNKPVGKIIPQAMPIEDRVQSLIDAGMVAWNGSQLSEIEPASKNQGEKQVSELLSEMRD